MGPVLESFRKTFRAVVVEEGYRSYGIGAEIDMPYSARIWTDNGEPRVVTGAELVGSADEQDYEGTLHVHRDFAAAIAEGRQPLTSLQSCLGTLRLIEALEGEQAPEAPATRT